MRNLDESVLTQLLVRIYWSILEGKKLEPVQV